MALRDIHLGQLQSILKKFKGIQRHRDHERYRAPNNWYRLGVLRSRKQHKTMGRRKQHNVSWVGPEFMAAGVE
jgi:hypothetical protein